MQCNQRVSLKIVTRLAMYNFFLSNSYKDPFRLDASPVSFLCIDLGESNFIKKRKYLSALHGSAFWQHSFNCIILHSVLSRWTLFLQDVVSFGITIVSRHLIAINEMNCLSLSASSPFKFKQVFLKLKLIQNPGRLNYNLSLL